MPLTFNVAVAMPISRDSGKDCVFQTDETEESTPRSEGHSRATLPVFVSLFSEKGVNRCPKTLRGYVINVGNTDLVRPRTTRFELYLRF